MSRKKHILAYARMNPPTPGHRMLVDKVLAMAKVNRCDHTVVLSRSQDKKNPLNPTAKLRFVKDIVGEANYVISTEELPSVIQWMTHLYNNGTEEVIYVCGSDRIREMQDLLEKYNGDEYDFHKITVVSAGDRDEEHWPSASTVREMVRRNDFHSFSNVYSEINNQLREEMFHLIKLFPINRPEREETTIGKAKEEEGR